MVVNEAGETIVPIKADTDIVVACQKGRTLAERTRFSSNDQVVVVIAISEVARNILRYANEGEVVLLPTSTNGQQGLTVIARDWGPGIPDLERAMEDGYSTGGGLGLGLSGAQRLMDEFAITSIPGEGTEITMTKWQK